MASGIDLSIIIITYNSSTTIKAAINSLIESNLKLRWELLVVDNNSSDNTLAIIKSIYPETKIITSKENLGFAAGCNRAVEGARGKYLLFYNPDLEVDKGAIDRYVEQFEKLESVGVATGRMRFPDGRFQSAARLFPTAQNLFFSRGSAISKLLGSQEKYTLPDSELSVEVEAVSGTFMLITKELFEKIGRFDQRFFMYVEDTDLCYRLSQAGYKNYYIPSVGGVHLWGKGSEVSSLRRSFYHHRSMWKYFLKHHLSFFSLFILPFLLGFNLFLKMIKPDNN